MARLKKGSAAAKAWGAKMRRLRSPKKRRKKPIQRRTKQKNKTMAKRKTTRRTRTASLFGVNTAKALGAGIYGALRSRTSLMLAPYTSRIPLGNVSDEVGMLVVSTLGKKYLFKKAGTLREALTAGQTIELARIGEAVATGSLGISFGNMGGGSASTGYNFA